MPLRQLSPQKGLHSICVMLQLLLVCSVAMGGVEKGPAKKLLDILSFDFLGWASQEPFSQIVFWIRYGLIAPLEEFATARLWHKGGMYCWLLQRLLSQQVAQEIEGRLESSPCQKDPEDNGFRGICDASNAVCDAERSDDAQKGDACPNEEIFR